MFDVDDNYINRYAGSIVAGANQTYLLRQDCADGKTLMCDSVSDLTITGRLYGSSDAFVDLASTGIDLSPYTGTRQTFEVKIVAGSVSARTKVFNFFIV